MPVLVLANFDRGCRVVRRVILLMGALTMGFLASIAEAETWSQWRGPQQNGSSDSATNLPVEWSRTENVAWVADLPGASAATPVVSGNHVFVSSDDAKRDTLLALALDRRTGATLWSRDIAGGVRQDTRSTYSSPSPTTDGEIVVFFYGNGAMVTFDFEGNELWRRDIQKEYGEFTFQWTFSSSPVLHGGVLYLQVLQRDVPVHGRGFSDRPNQSYLLALNPKTGEQLWRHVRPSKARAESLESFATPVPATIGGKQQLLVVGGDALTGHDLKTGAELWRWGTWNPQRIPHWRHVPSPVAIGDVVLVCAPKRDPVYAIRINGSETEVAWDSSQQRPVSSDVPTPAVFEGDFIVLSDVRKHISRVRADTGEVVWQTRTPGTDKFEASPTVADGKIYIVNFVGDVVVLDAASGKILNNVSMDEPAEDAVRSTVVVDGHQLLLRMNRKLYCIGK